MLREGLGGIYSSSLEAIHSVFSCAVCLEGAGLLIELRCDICLQDVITSAFG